MQGCVVEQMENVWLILEFCISGGGGVFQILTQRGGAYWRGGLNRVCTVISYQYDDVRTPERNYELRVCQ